MQKDLDSVRLRREKSIDFITDKCYYTIVSEN